MDSRINALIIGCGNIGAGYDLDLKDMVWTHAKAYSSKSEIKLHLFDEDILKARSVADKYKADICESLDSVNYKEFDLVSITTPTVTHFHYLQQTIGKVPVIICEKPVVSNSGDAEQLQKLYEKGGSKVLVNYMRRFLPAYKDVKACINEKKAREGLRQIIVKYKRGFLNNAGHAIDLLEFFFDERLYLHDLKIAAASFDAFEYDPTVTGTVDYAGCPLSFNGVSDVTYAVFEVELFFGNSKVVVCHSGDEIRYYQERDGQLAEDSIKRQIGLLKTYMLPVLDVAIHMLHNRDAEDNFISSLQINKEILQIIEPIKSMSNATISH
jgi:predicted dehydrogenase